jgi:hypothetical protein
MKRLLIALLLSSAAGAQTHTPEHHTTSLMLYYLPPSPLPGYNLEILLPRAMVSVSTSDPSIVGYVITITYTMDGQSQIQSALVSRNTQYFANGFTWVEFTFPNPDQITDLSATAYGVAPKGPIVTSNVN